MTLTSDDAKRIREACEAWQPLSPMPAVFLTAAQVALPQVPDLIEEVERLRADVGLCGESLDAAMSQIEQMKAQAYGERKGAADITREVVAEHNRLLEMLAEARQQRDEAREQFGDLQEDYTELELELQDVRQQRDALAAFITDAKNKPRPWLAYPTLLDCALFLLADRIRRERAEAWDEGRLAGQVYKQQAINPYRDTEGAER